MTNRGRWLAFAIVCWFGAGLAWGQELSTEVFPSEDELLEALRLGEITYDQYVQLRELARQGIDSTNLYLLDEIPNLSYFAGTDSALTSGLENTQEDALYGDRAYGLYETHGYIEHRYFQPLEEDAHGGYRTRADLRPYQGWRARLQVDRELSGTERCTGRSIEYRGSGPWRRIIVGSYTARLGTGTALGYRGDLLDYSRSLDGESWVYPDYGGYNGVYVEHVQASTNTTFLTSVNRDSTFRVTTNAFMLETKLGATTPRLIFAHTHLENRNNGRHLSLPAVSLGVRHRYEQSYADGEINYQLRGKHAVWSGVVEGRHRTDETELRYAAWSYGRHLADLASGSKAGALTRTVTLEEVDFKMSDRRAGQTGGLVRTGLQLSGRWRLTSSILYAGFNRDHSNFQLSSELLYQRGHTAWQADYLGTWKERPTQTSTTRQHRWRFEHRIQLGTLRLRSYIAYTRRDNGYDYLGLLHHLCRETTRFGMIEFWSNIGRINSDGVQYWYAFLRVEQRWFSRVGTAVKFSHTYNRVSDDRSVAQLALEMRGTL